MTIWLLKVLDYAWKYHLGILIEKIEMGRKTTIISSEKAHVIKVQQREAAKQIQN